MPADLPREAEPSPSEAESAALPRGASGAIGRHGFSRRRLWRMLVAVAAIVPADLATKGWVVRNYELYQSVPVIGDFFRLTYIHNRGAAFGLDVGEHSRLIFLVFSLLALVFLAMLYRDTPSEDRLRLLGIPIIVAGALGNICDRIRYERGVVDFLDFGIGTSRFPVFNVADSAVTIGTALLFASFWATARRERAQMAEAKRAAAAQGGQAPDGGRSDPE